jgi:hypothetical protein
VTFVFTDVQNSTKLWESHSNGMSAGLQKHDALFRALLKQFNGYEVKTEGVRLSSFARFISTLLSRFTFSFPSLFHSKIFFFCFFQDYRPISLCSSLCILLY